MDPTFVQLELYGTQACPSDQAQPGAPAKI